MITHIELLAGPQPEYDIAQDQLIGLEPGDLFVKIHDYSRASYQKFVERLHPDYRDSEVKWYVYLGKIPFDPEFPRRSCRHRIWKCDDGDGPEGHIGWVYGQFLGSGVQVVSRMCDNLE